jgi:hypothetical protein
VNQGHQHPRVDRAVLPQKKPTEPIPRPGGWFAGNGRTAEKSGPSNRTGLSGRNPALPPLGKAGFLRISGVIGRLTQSTHHLEGRRQFDRCAVSMSRCARRRVLPGPLLRDIVGWMVRSLSSKTSERYRRRLRRRRWPC